VLRVKQNVDVKTKLSHTLRNWLPILQTSLSELEDTLKPFVESNPLVEIDSGFEEKFEKKIPKKILSGHVSNASSEHIEALTIQQKSLYDILDEQICAPLFPTPQSQHIAEFIISNLDENGYYEGDSDAYCQEEGVDIISFEKIRERFAYIEPVGIASLDVRESFLFQLDASDISSDAYPLAKVMIADMDNLHNYAQEEHFSHIMKIINSFKNPPAIDYFEESQEIISDIMIYNNDDGLIEVKLNDGYYPTISIDTEYGVEHSYISEKLKEAKNLVDALDMRKATLYKIGLMIVEYQYDFFMGGDIKPLTLQMLADEFGHNPSTISRAISNKYISCDRGIFAIKEFFTTAIDEDVSNAAIKEYMLQLVKNEPREKPLSDMKMLALITEKFKIKMVRRTLAKYRKQLNIAGSSERKKLYKLEV
jgi:RNA polymerase sigma-54 factor